MQHLQPKTTLQGGKYIIERVLGQGGFGNTYEGVNTTFEDRVCIKEFFMQGINDRDNATGSITVSLVRNKPQFEEQLEKFKKEALRIRKLDNPHIVKVHDLFEENGTAYYVMDYVDGENLAERLKRTGKPMTEEEIRGILPQILDALKTVHSTGIWHLDLKPANIMLTKEGQVKLIDFGASKQLNAKKGGATTSTAISYTNGYAPREQMEQNYDKFGPWTDIYALGATIYTLLTNKRPPLPTNIDDDMSEDKHLALPFPDGISKDIQDLVLAMMRTNKNQRPQNVEEILAVLSESNQKDNVVFDTLSEETIIDPKRNTAKKGQDLFNNEKTQIDTLNKDVGIKNETKKQTKTRLLIGIAILFILGCIGWIIYHNSNEKKSLYKTLIINNDSDPNSDYTPDINGNLCKVFKVLKNEGYTDIGNDEAEFGRLMEDSTNRRMVYDVLKKEGYTDIGKDYHEFEKLIYQAQNDNKRKLYNALSVDYDLGNFEQFSKDVQDTVKCRKLYNAIKDEYFVPEFDEFSKLLGVATKSNGKREGLLIDKKEIENNRRKLHNALVGKFVDLGNFEQFSKKVQDPDKCKMLYNAIKDDYFVPEFDEFSVLLGVKR